MAGLRSLTPHLHLRRPSLSLSLSLTHHRHRSNKSDKYHPHFIELDLDPSSESTNTRIRKLDDVIHNIIVRRSAPDWLPFLPGSSYWVPPRSRSGPAGLADVIGKLSGPLRPARSEEETLSFSSIRGWPSSAYYIEGSGGHTRPMPVDVHVVEVKFQEDSDNESKSENEEQ